IHGHTTHLMIARVQQKHEVLLLDELHPKLDRQDERRRLRPALVMRTWERSAADLQVGLLLHDLRGRWVQNRICVIAGCAKDRGPFWPSQLADNRAGSRCRRFEQEQRAHPDASQIGDRSRGRLGLRRYRYANGRHHRRGQNKETAAPAHVPPPFALFPLYRAIGIWLVLRIPAKTQTSFSVPWAMRQNKRTVRKGAVVISV